MPDLYRELSKLADSDMYPFHMPGHKRNLESTPMKGAFRCDITEIDDYDNLHDAKGIILEAQQRANRIYGAEETFFLVNGSTCGVLSAVSAIVPEGGRILAARGSHKSFYNAAYLKNLDIKYLPYKVNTKYQIPETYGSEDVEKALDESIQAVFITSPTYEGKCADIRGIVEVCHKRGIPVVIDAAHGAHFGLGAKSALPENAVSQGADLVIHSVHKTLPSMTQTALLHVQGNLVDRVKLKRFLSIYQTSSPSYVLMASIDLCMKYIEENGKEFVDRLLEYRKLLEDAAKECRFIEIPGKTIIPDAAKVLIYVKNAAMTGHELYDILREEYKLQLEMAGEKYALAIISGWDTREGIDRLISAIRQIDLGISAKKTVKPEEEQIKVVSLPEQELSIQSAWDTEKESAFIQDAVGRISGEFINLYPPGIPLIVPGERFSKELVCDISRYIKEGLTVQGIVNRKEVICVKPK